jgi:AcrR family transcriptional regulator
MTSASPKSSSVLASPFRAPPDAAPEAGDKRDRILDAAQSLFLRYGVKRTSIDDVAREAGVAKGTVYLSFESKAALFAAIAERLCANVLSDALGIATGAAPLAERLVGVLDRAIGANHRLVAQSPHIAELTASKGALSATAFEALESEVRSLLAALLGEAGIACEGATDMVLAAAHGTLSTGDCAEQPYRARLAAMIDTLVAGLACDVKGRATTRAALSPPIGSGSV